MRIANTKELGKFIRHVRKEQKCTQQFIAGSNRVGTRFISDLENGKATCEIGKVLKVMRSLGIMVDLTEIKL